MASEQVTKPKRTMQLELTPLTAAHLPEATELSRAVQWPHRLEDWQFVLSLGEGLAAHAEGRLVGTAMHWNYERSLTRIGMVLVDPAAHRAGIGRSLMVALLDRIAAPTIVLNATEAGGPLYRNLGFIETATIFQHQGTTASVPPASLRLGERIRPFGRNDNARLVELDANAFGIRRPQVLASLVEVAEAVVLDDAGEAAGFAFCRRFGRGLVIGPVVARDVQAAQALLAHWIGSNSGKFVRVDVPADAALSPWLEGLGLTRCDQVTTMCRGAAPSSTGPFRTFALANQALG